MTVTSDNESRSSRLISLMIEILKNFINKFRPEEYHRDRKDEFFRHFHPLLQNALHLTGAVLHEILFEHFDVIKKKNLITKKTLNQTLVLTSLGKRGKRPPLFQNSSKKIFHIDSELLRSRDSKS